MSLQSIIVVNTAPGCNNLIEQQISADTCNNYIVRITSTTNALGPFDVYIDTTGSTPVYSAQTRTQMINGVVVQLGPCVTPTPTPTPVTPTPTPSGPTPTPTPTTTQTPTNTSTNTPTPSQTPTNSNTPTQTPTETPTQTPTQTVTQTPSETPTQTPTADVTPTPTQTPTQTITETPTETPTQTPTPTNTETPTQTPTNTETPTQTPTQTQTPSPTISVFEISVITQDGFELINQDGSNWILQQESTSYLVSSGDSSCLSGSYSLTQTLYSSSPDWSTVVSLYTDVQLTIPFNGNNLWYTNDAGGCGMYQVGTDGFVIGGLCNPC